MAIFFEAFEFLSDNAQLTYPLQNVKSKDSIDKLKNSNDCIFIGPESDHWLCLSLTPSLPPSCLVNLIDLALACEDANSKLVEAITVAHVDDENCVGNSLLQIWTLTFGPKATLLFRL